MGIELSILLALLFQQAAKYHAESSDNMRQNRDTRILPLGTTSPVKYIHAGGNPMTKFKRAKFTLLAPAVVILLSPFAAAQALTTQVTATEFFDPLNLFGSGSIGAFINTGTLTCPGTQPTGDPMQPCPPGSRINLRGTASMTRVTAQFPAQSPLLTGWVYLEGNGDLDTNGAGHVSGKFLVELDAGGTWEGTWVVDREKVANMWVGHLKAVGRGTSGNVTGMQLRFTEVLTSFTLIPVAYIGSIDAQIVEPPPVQ